MEPLLYVKRYGAQFNSAGQETLFHDSLSGISGWPALLVAGFGFAFRQHWVEIVDKQYGRVDHGMTACLPFRQTARISSAIGGTKLKEDKQHQGIWGDHAEKCNGKRDDGGEEECNADRRRGQQ